MLITTHSVEETLRLGRIMGRIAPPAPVNRPLCLALDGQLGAGKTHLTRGIAEGAGVDDPTLVSSPTYVLLNIYDGPRPVYHLDAYRIASPEDFEAVGFEELLAGEEPPATVPGQKETAAGFVIVEWAQRIADLLPEDRVQITLQHGDDSGDPAQTDRRIDIAATGPRAQLWLDRLAAEWNTGE